MNVSLTLQNATRMLAEVRDATDAKKVVDAAHAAEVYAKRQKMGEEAIGYAHSIKIDALRMLGQFMQKAEKNKGTRSQKITKSPGGARVEPPDDDTPTLADIGLTKKESATSQQLAEIAKDRPDDFEAIKNRTKSITQVAREIRKAELAEKTIKFPSGKIQVKCDWRCGDGPGCSGNLFLQKAERNPLRRV